MNSIKSFNVNNYSDSDWRNPGKLREIVSHLDKCEAIQIEETVHQRIPWDSGYQDVLHWHCGNHVKADIIFKAFNTHFFQMAEGRSKEAVRQFILRNHAFIGIRPVEFDFNASSIKDLADNLFLSRFAAFIEEVRQELQKHYHIDRDQQERIKNIAVITCNAGGGHRIVANCINDFLNKNDYQAKVINVDELDGDHLNIASRGAIKSFEVYSKFRCQENNHLVADLLCDIRWRLHHFLPQRIHHEANVAVKELSADLIINTIHHETEWISMIQEMDSKVFFYNTDYTLPGQLKKLAYSIRSPDFKILTPIEYPEDVPGMFPIGYPVREGFEQILSEEERSACKKEFGIEEGDTATIIQMGSLAMGIEEDVRVLTEAAGKKKERCHLIFLCANNQAAKDAIETIKSKAPENVLLHALGFQNDHQLGRLYQSLALIGGKTGGGTVAEAAATGAYMLVYRPLPWERPNLQYIVERNQAKEVNSLAELIEASSKFSKPAENQSVLDWKNRLIEVIKSETFTSDQLKVVKPNNHSKLSSLLTRWFSRFSQEFLSIFTYIGHFFSYLRQMELSSFFARSRHFWKYT